MPRCNAFVSVRLKMAGLDLAVTLHLPPRVAAFVKRWIGLPT
jgi:hypothetical protein